MNHERLSQYRVMWVFVHFDMPTATKAERKKYSTFRNQLLDYGFTMMQFSIYARHCISREKAQSIKNRVKQSLPNCGKFIIFEITDKQFGMMEFYIGTSLGGKPSNPDQLEIF